MKQHLSKIFAPLLVVLFALSFLAFSAPIVHQTVAAQDALLTPEPPKGPKPTLDPSQTAAAQEKAIAIIQNVMMVDLSKYALELKSNSIMDGIPLSNVSRKITNLRYALTPKEGNGNEHNVIEVCFAFEKDKVTQYFITPFDAQIITTTQYTNHHDAVVGFLEKYQQNTHIDSNNLKAMLNNVDLSTNSTTIKENTKLVVATNSFWGTDQTQLIWTYTVNGADYTKLEISVNTDGFVRSVYDTRALYTIGDTSVNISMKQAVEIAIDNLQFYSYKMPDGSVVKDFKANKNATLPELLVLPVDYELRPYWSVSMYLDEVYPGGVFGIKAFIWADTGEIISYTNMATSTISTEGTYANEDHHVSGTGSPVSSGNVLVFVIVAVVAVAVAALTIGLVVKKRHR
jgi:hypothetical protein